MPPPLSTWLVRLTDRLGLAVARKTILGKRRRGRGRGQDALQLSLVGAEQQSAPEDPGLRFQG